MILKSLYNQNLSEQLISFSAMSYVIRKKTKPTYREIECFISGINELADSGFLKIISKDKDYILDLYGLYDYGYKTKQVELTEDDDGYDCFENLTKKEKTKTFFSTFDLDSIGNVYSKCNQNKAILKYIIYLIKMKENNVHNEKNKELPTFIKTMEEIEFETGISKKTIIKYNKILEDEKIIYITQYTGKNGKKVNRYGLYKDKKFIDSMLNQ